LNHTKKLFIVIKIKNNILNLYLLILYERRRYYIKRPTKNYI